MPAIHTFDRPMPRVAAALACLYAPYSWLLWIGGPLDSYRWSWIKLWPVLPGLFVHLIPAVHQLPDRVSMLLMAGVTAMIVAATLALVRRGEAISSSTLVIVVTLSCFNAWMAYQLYMY